MKISILLSSLLITFVAGAPAPFDSGLPNAGEFTSLKNSERLDQKHTQADAEAWNVNNGPTGTNASFRKNSASTDELHHQKDSEFVRATKGTSPGGSEFTSIKDSERLDQKHTQEDAEAWDVNNGPTGTNASFRKNSASTDELHHQKDSEFVRAIGATAPGSSFGSSSGSSGSFAESLFSFHRNWQKSWSQFKFKDGNMVFSGTSDRFGSLWRGRGSSTCDRSNIDITHSPVCAMSLIGDQLAIFSLQTTRSGVVPIPYRSSGFSFSRETKSDSSQRSAMYVNKQNGAYGFSFQNDSSFSEHTKVASRYSSVFSPSPVSSNGKFVAFTQRKVCLNNLSLVVIERSGYTAMMCSNNGVEKLVWVTNCSGPIAGCMVVKVVIIGS